MNKVINWFCGSFIRTIGRFLAFVVIGMLVATLLHNSNIKITDLFGIQRVYAESYTPGSWTNGIVYYKDSSKTQLYDYLANSGGTTYYTSVQTSTSQYTWYTSTDFYFNQSFDLSSKSGGHIDFQLNVGLPRVLRNNANTIYTHYCTNWSPEAPTGNVAYSCSYIDQDTNTINDSEYIIPKTSFKALLYYGSGYVDCVFNSNTNVISCPILSWATSVNRLTIQSYVQYSTTNSYDYYLELGNVPAVYVSDSKDITNNQNQNTQQVINNQNANTNATIENQNQNTQASIDSQKICKFYDKSSISISNNYLDINNVLNSASIFGVTDYIPFKKNSSTLELLSTYDWNDLAAFCQYDVNKTKISCSKLINFTNDFVFDNNVNYIRVTIQTNYNKPQFRICTNGNQAMADTITDTSGPDNLGTIDNDTLVGYLPPGPVDSLITLPLVVLNGINNSLSTTCSPISLTLPFINQNIELPCMQSLYQQMGVLTYLNWVGILASAFLLYSYLIRFYKWVDNVLTFRENNYLDNWGGAD